MVPVLHKIKYSENLLQLISELSICVLQANLSNQMMYSNSVIIKADKRIGSVNPLCQSS